MTSKKFYVVAALLSSVLMMSSGCKSLSTAEFQIFGRPNTNSGNVVEVHVFELSSDVNFRQATSESFWRDVTAAIGDELVKRHTLLLYPGQVMDHSIELSKEAIAVGVAADFADPSKDGWRDVYTFRSAKIKKAKIRVEIAENTVSVSRQ